MSRSLIALVTGSSRGIGQAIATALSQQKYQLILTGRDQKALEQTASLCAQHSGEPHLIYPCDLTEEGGCNRLAQAACDRFGRLDVLVNNAGYAPTGRFEQASQIDWDHTMNINARVPFLLTQSCLPMLKESPHAAIINIGSVVACKGYENQSVYSASKHALAGWTKVLAKEVATDGIRVHLINPGGVATEMVKKTRPDLNADQMIQCQDIANAVVFLLQSRGKAVIDVMNIRREGKTPFD